MFTANGSRVYIDSGLHPEVASPECSTPEETVLFTRAGDRLLARAFHLEHVVSENSTRERGIFHTRDEPFATGRYRRAHVLAGESLWSETADYLRVGTTALLVAQIDGGRRPQAGLDLDSPLEALATIASDVRCRTAVGLRPSGRLTAIAIQRRLLESVEADLGATHLPAWAQSVCERWRLVLDQLATSPSSLIGILDWPTKLAVLERQCEAQGVAWTFSAHTFGRGTANATPNGPAENPARPFACKLLEMDMRFNRLDEQGIFAALDRQAALAQRIVSPAAIGYAVHKPPSTGRARIRAACVNRLAGNAAKVTCNWQEIVDHERGQRLVLGDPFQCDEGHWSPLPEPDAVATGGVDQSVQPIRDAFAR